MAVTHKDIADRIVEIEKEQDAALEEERMLVQKARDLEAAAYRQHLDRFGAERRSLQELCGGLGHIVKPNGIWGPRCVICGRDERVFGAAPAISFGSPKGL